MTFLGSTVTSNSSGVAHFTVKKGTTPGTYKATASKSGYAMGTATVKVT